MVAASPSKIRSRSRSVSSSNSARGGEGAQIMISSPKPTPPRAPANASSPRHASPKSAAAAGGNSTTGNGNAIGNSGLGGSGGGPGSVTSRGSNNTRPSASPEGRSVVTKSSGGGRSKGGSSADNQRDVGFATTNKGNSNFASGGGGGGGTGVASSSPSSSPVKKIGLPKNPVLPKNPKDTEVGAGGASPKRRIMMSGGGVSGGNLSAPGTPNATGNSSSSISNNNNSINFVGTNSVGGRSLVGGQGGGRAVASYRGAAAGAGGSSQGAPAMLAQQAITSPMQLGTLTTNSNRPPTHGGGSIVSGTQNASGNGGGGNVILDRQRSTSLDDDEQYMFEQRLTQDELGVAIRKISHSGKAQLRYVKCVVLRPPSSSDYHVDFGGNNVNSVGTGGVTGSLGGLGGAIDGSGGGGGGGGRGGKSVLNLPYLTDTHGRSRVPSDAVSVSSKSSTGSRFLERMRSTKGIGNMRRLIPSSSASHSANVGGGGDAVAMGFMNSDSNLMMGNDYPEDEINIQLLTSANKDEMSIHMEGAMSGGARAGGRSHRALTWGKKNAVQLSLDKFTCVRKGKTTERTMRNSSPSCRLLSIVTCVMGREGRGHESLDIEAPTMLDRDKFASAFARFLGVPLVEEGEQQPQQETAGGLPPSASAAADARSTTRRPRVGSVTRRMRTPSLTRRKRQQQQQPHLQQQQQQQQQPRGAAHSEPGPSPLLSASAVQQQQPSLSPSYSATSTPKVRNNRSNAGAQGEEGLLPALTPNSDKERDADRELAFDDDFGAGQRAKDGAAAGVTTISGIGSTVGAATSSSSRGGNAVGSMQQPGGDAAETQSKHTLETMSASARKRISLDGSAQGAQESMLEPRNSSSLASHPQDGGGNDASGGANRNANGDDDNHSHVSSLTGGVDQEIVEELHQAIIELRSELDASRAEAARAVKVAEQAIQSAENCSSGDWNSTVTHKAAEAAAQAQKKSAEAIARARMAEERLEKERKSTAFWRRAAQEAEEEAGSLKTRTAASEVKQAVMMEELASERRKAARMFANLKQEFVKSEKRMGGEIEAVQKDKRALEVELKEVKGEMKSRDEAERKAAELDAERKEKTKGSNRMKASFRRNKSSLSSEPKSGKSSPIPIRDPSPLPQSGDAAGTDIAKLQNELRALQKQFELVRHESKEKILTLRRQSEEWSSQANRAISASTVETDHLREKLAAESAMRLKLLNELQDIRGTARVYIRPKPCAKKSVLTIPTHDILVLNGDQSFKYDRVFAPGASQHEVFSELEEPLISSLDGFNVTLLAFGASSSGKTHALLGDVSLTSINSGGGTEDAAQLPSPKTYGVQMQSVQQLFTIAGHRTDRYKDSFTMTMVEVHNEKLSDLVAGTPSGERDGEVIICETRDRRGADNSAAAWRKGKLEIRTNIDGNTVVQGLVSVPIQSFEEALSIWREAMAHRAEQLELQGVDIGTHEKKTSIITTVNITSVNIATGVGTEGKLQLVDMASSDIVRGGARKTSVEVDASSNGMVEKEGTEFENKSLNAFDDVINARCQFDRSVPYRNSTLTHLLRDSLEADTKLLLLCCVSSEQEHVEDTIGALRFASRMQKVSIGKATKHIVGSKEC